MRLRAVNKSASGRKGAERALLEHIPCAVAAAPGGAARSAIWLASDLFDDVVGTTLFVDGGMLLYPGLREGG